METTETPSRQEIAPGYSPADEYEKTTATEPTSQPSTSAWPQGSPTDGDHEYPSTVLAAVIMGSCLLSVILLSLVRTIYPILCRIAATNKRTNVYMHTDNTLQDQTIIGTAIPSITKEFSECCFIIISDR